MDPGREPVCLSVCPTWSSSSKWDSVPLLLKVNSSFKQSHQPCSVGAGPPQRLQGLGWYRSRSRQCWRAGGLLTGLAQS